MIENRRGLTIFSHTMLILGIMVILFPLYVAFVAATLDNKAVFETPMTLVPGTHLLENMYTIWVNGVGVNSAPFWLMMLNSFIMAFSITVGKITVSMLSAFAIVWFRFPLRNLFFWMIFITLMLPVEVRIFPTVEVIANLKMLDSYAGLTLPLMASATATFLFRQFFMTLPDELVEGVLQTIVEVAHTGNVGDGIVWVTPGAFPANNAVAPNSPIARAKLRTTPATRPGAARGNVTRRRIVHRLAPSPAAVSSNAVPVVRSAPSTASTRKGSATKV